MKKLLAILLIIVGIVVGTYLGLWICFVGGILGIVSVINKLIDGTGIDGMLIVWSVLKIMLAGLVGYLSAAVCILPAMVILKK